MWMWVCVIVLFCRSTGLDPALVRRVSIGDPEQIDLCEYGELMNSIPRLELLSSNDMFAEQLLPAVHEFVGKRIAASQWDKLFIPLRSQAMVSLHGVVCVCVCVFVVGSICSLLPSFTIGGTHSISWFLSTLHSVKVCI
jgi:hypothetical protein